MTRSVPPERLPKLDVAGSNPVGRSTTTGLRGSLVDVFTSYFFAVFALPFTCV
jgi:hypothetical protein